MNVIPDSPWAAVGLDAISGRVLEYLVGAQSADAAAIADAAEISPREAEEALRRLEGALLVMRLDGQPVRWAASPPRSSLGAMLARRRAELAAAEGILERLQEAYEAMSGPRAAHLIEMLEREEEVSARYTQLLKQSSVEVLHLAKPPYLTGADVSSGELGVVAGVRLRSVYETDGFTDPVSLETALRGTAEGGELRLASRLPVKLVVFDRTAALLPVRSDRPEAGSLVVHSPRWWRRWRRCSRACGRGLRRCRWRAGTTGRCRAGRTAPVARMVQKARAARTRPGSTSEHMRYSG